MYHLPIDPSTLAETARIWWNLFGYYLFLALVIGGVVMAALIVIPIVYSRRSGNAEPEDAIKPGELPKDRGRTAGIVLIVILLLGVFLGLLTQSLQATEQFLEPPEYDKVLEIEVRAFQWGFTFIYPNGIETDTLIIPEDTLIIFKVTSEDVFHTFAIPDLRVKVDAIPGRVNEAWTIAYQPGVYRIQCYELCGVGHAEMITRLKVVTEDVFQVWYESNAPQEGSEGELLSSHIAE